MLYDRLSQNQTELCSTNDFLVGNFYAKKTIERAALTLSLVSRSTFATAPPPSPLAPLYLVLVSCILQFLKLHAANHPGPPGPIRTPVFLVRRNANCLFWVVEKKKRKDIEYVI